MILTAVTPEKGEKMTHRWIAIWRGRSAFIHQDLPLTVEHDTAAAARKYALANPPVWKTA